MGNILHEVWSWYPPVGVFIGILALLGVIVPLLRDLGKIGPRERAVWTAVMFALVLLEMKSIYQDRDVHDREQKTARKEQLDQFSKIADRMDKNLENSQRQFEVTVSELTGGSSYFYYECQMLGGPIEIDVPGAKKGAMLLNAYPRLAGSYPMHNLHVETIGPAGRLPSIDYGTFSPGELGRSRYGLSLSFMPDKAKQFFSIFINSSNGSYAQIILVEKIDDKWLWASRLYKGASRKPFRTWAAKGFPGEQLKPNAKWD